MTRHIQTVVLDLFCGAGGASRGYADQGAVVLGIDHRRQPDYPYPFLQMDAMAALAALIRGEALWFRPFGGGETIALWAKDVDLYHGSPPCQPYSVTRHTHSNVHPELVPQVRGMFRELRSMTGAHYVIENVEGAPLEEPVTLCGEMFGLRAKDDDGTDLVLRRHRLFETSFIVVEPRHEHSGDRVAGVYGGGTSRRSPDDPALRGGYTPKLHVRQALMELPGMKQKPLSQAIPPAYTRHVFDWYWALVSTQHARRILP